MVENAVHWSEPGLRFKLGSQERICDPRVGLDKYGPLDSNTHRRTFRQIRLALICKKDDFTRVHALLSKLNSKFRPRGRSSQVQYKGFSQIYRLPLKLPTKEKSALLSGQEIYNTLNSEDPFESIVKLYRSKIQEIQNKISGKYDVLIIQIPRDFDNYQLSNGRDLRCYIKVFAIRKDIRTQIITEKALTSWDDCDNMWHLSVGIYTKAGGVPWTLQRLPTTACFVGIAYGIKSPGSGQTVLSGLVEIFDQWGEHVTMYTINAEEFGKDFILETDGSYHLSEEKMKTLLENLIEEYKKAKEGDTPTNVIIHKTTFFNGNEITGVEKALKKHNISYDLVHVQSYSSQRLLTSGIFPPKRGVFWKIDERSGIIYTTGYVTDFQTYPGAGSPIPLKLCRDQGGSGIDVLAKQVLALTKMDWNSANLMLRDPVTTKYASKVVDVLKAGLEADELIRDIRYYM
jgi:hypothetical protein